METEGWWACWTPTLPPPPPRTLPAAPLLAGCASPSRQSPLQLLLASGSRQEGGHGGTSPFRQSSALTCTRPCPQSGGWGWGGVEDGHQAGDTERPSEGSHSPTPTPGLPPQMPPAPAQLLSPVPPAQGCRPQGALSWGGPGQGAPPFLGGGSIQLLRRLRWPPPHETLQGPQASHSAHAPATAGEREEERG